MSPIVRGRWYLLPGRSEGHVWRVIFVAAACWEAINDVREHWFLKTWQAWADHRCALFGHQRRTTSCYCSVCRRLQMDWLVSDGAKALALAIDERVFEKIMAELKS